jgi:hypothetical protein
MFGGVHPRLKRFECIIGVQRQRDLLLIAELGEDVGWSRLTAGDELFETLRDDLAEALVPIVEGTTLPAKERVQAGVYLCEVGDPRPGVCTLPPQMVRIAGGMFTMGDEDEDEEHQVTLATFEIARSPFATDSQGGVFFQRGFPSTP